MRVFAYAGAVALALMLATPGLADPQPSAEAARDHAMPEFKVINSGAAPAATAEPSADSAQKAESTPPPASTESAAPATANPSGNSAPAAPPATATGTDAATAVPAPSGTETKPDAAAAPPPPPPKPTLSVDINLSSQRMTVSEFGTQKYSWAISSGRSGYVTPTGTFRPLWTAKMWYSKKYDDAPMPNAVFFSGGTAIHGTYATGSLGSPASHGCVRLAPGNAATLYRLVGKHGNMLTRIVVHGSPRYRDPAVASRGNGSRSYASSRRGYGYAPRYADDGYDAPYYAPPRARRYYAPPRRYVSRGYYYGGYGYGYGYGY